MRLNSSYIKDIRIAKRDMVLTDRSIKFWWSFESYLILKFGAGRVRVLNFCSKSDFLIIQREKETDHFQSEK